MGRSGAVRRTVNRDNALDAFHGEKMCVKSMCLEYRRKTASVPVFLLDIYTFPGKNTQNRNTSHLLEFTPSIPGASIPAERIFSKLKICPIEKDQFKFNN